MGSGQGRAGDPRVVLFTTGYSHFLSLLLDSGRSLCGVVQNVPRPRGARPGAARPALHRLASAGYRMLGRGLPEVRALASRRGIPYHLMDRGCDEKLARWVRERAPDLIVVCGMVELLEREIYSIPPLGAINLHPSLLPRYRGPDPLFWAYHDMDLLGGATVHAVDDGADTGDILFQESFRIRLGTPRGHTAGQAMGVIGPRLMFRAMDALARGDCPRLPQPAASPTPRARRVRLAEYRGLIGWESWPIERVWHFLRGTEPWLAALGSPPGWRHRLDWVVGECVPGRPPGGAPGSIVRDGDGHCIAHPQGRIRLAVRYSAAGLGRTVLGFSRTFPRQTPARNVAGPGNPS